MKKSLVILMALLSVGSFSLEAAKDAQPSITTVFCHGIIDNNSQINHYLNKSIFGKNFSFDFPDATPNRSINFDGLISQVTGLFNKSEEKPFGKQINRDQMFMGQTKDIECLGENLLPLKNEPVILYGVSRGAATIISYLGKAQDISNIKAIVLEAPPANMLDAIDNTSAKIGITLSKKLFSKIFYQYPEDPYTPIDAIKDIQNKDLPIFITYSAADTTVNPSQAWKLYKTFKENGFKNVYIHEIETGRHCHLHLKQNFYREYCLPVQSFYKKFNLFNREVINIELYNLQPTVKYAENKIKQFLDQRNVSYQLNRKKNALKIAILATLSSLLYYSSTK